MSFLFLTHCKIHLLLEFETGLVYFETAWCSKWYGCYYTQTLLSKRISYDMYASIFSIILTDI